jgi:hypothetical protein
LSRNSNRTNHKAVVAGETVIVAAAVVVVAVDAVVGADVDGAVIKHKPVTMI